MSAPVRSRTWVGPCMERKESFYLPPETSRSLSATDFGWLVEDVVSHRGRIGAFFDFMHELYVSIPVLAPLIARLIKYLGLGFRAYFMLWRLIFFALALSPAISKVGYWWWRSPTIIRSLRYGKNPRNFLDIYTTNTKIAPVVVFVTGGAWIIGHRAWAASVGEYWSRKGIVTVSVDYRNFPQGTFFDMVQDVETAINWIFDTIEQYGGDPTNITLVGQSAGAHICAHMLLSSSVTPPVRQFVGVSGPYDMVSLAPRLHKRGLYTTMLKSIMGNDLFAVSPSRIPIRATSLPPILLLHGKADISVPYESSVEFFQSLKLASREVEIELWEDIGHSHPLVEDLAIGNYYLPHRILRLIDPTDESSSSENPIMNKTFVRIAKQLMPF